MGVYLILKTISVLSLIFLTANGLECPDEENEDPQPFEPAESFNVSEIEVHSRHRRAINVNFASTMSKCSPGTFKHDPHFCSFFYKCVKILFIVKWQKFKCVFGCYDVDKRICMKKPIKTCRDLPNSRYCVCLCPPYKPIPTTTTTRRPPPTRPPTPPPTPPPPPPPPTTDSPDPGPDPTTKTPDPETTTNAPDPETTTKPPDPETTTYSPVPDPITTYPDPDPVTDSPDPYPGPTTNNPYPGTTEVPNPCPSYLSTNESGGDIYQFGETRPPAEVMEGTQKIQGTSILSGVPYRISPYDLVSHLRTVETSEGNLVLNTTYSSWTCNDGVFFKFVYVKGKLLLVNIKYSAVLMGGNEGSHQKEGDVVGEVALIEEDKWFCGDGRKNFYCKNQRELDISLREVRGIVFISMVSKENGRSIWYGEKGKGHDKPVTFKEEPEKIGNNHAFVFKMDCSCINKQ